MKQYTARGKRILRPPTQRIRFAIPQRVAHPAVMIIWQTLNRRPELTLAAVARKSGVTARGIRKWGKGGNPRVADLEAVLNAMNLRLTVDSMLTINSDAVS